MKIYCSGIGGMGLSAYAALQSASGCDISGSDREHSSITESLESEGISVFNNQDGSHVQEDLDLFVYSEAIPKDAPERLRAMELHIPQKSFFEALGDLSKNYCVIAVCGTHGKTTTTAMAAQMLLENGKDPTVIIGARTPVLNGRNWRKGSSDLFLVEACEYRRNFLHLQPNIILMTNADGDHFDAFTSIEDYQQAFAEFLRKLPSDGTVITHGQDSDCMNIVEQSDMQECMLNADDIPLPDICVPLCVTYMTDNALLVYKLGEYLGIARHALSLRDYKGCERRMEEKGTLENDVLIVDDYAHHPVEIMNTLIALRQKYPNRRIVCAFQPHMHDRTLRFYKEFCEVFKGVCSLVLIDPYDARPDVEKDMVDMNKFAKDAGGRYGGSLKKAEVLLRETILQPGDVLVCMGAGDITKLSTSLLQRKIVRA